MQDLQRDLAESDPPDVNADIASAHRGSGHVHMGARNRPFRSRLNLHALRSNQLVSRASWTLLNQALVSAGNFVLNILLARQLSASDYGTFALFLGVIYILRNVDYSFISYPFSIKLHVTPVDEHGRLLSTTVLLCTFLTIGLATLLALGVMLLGRLDIILPVVVCFLAWQTQETMRRCLLGDFLYRAAMLGDAISFVGQAIIIAVAARLTTLTFGTVLYLMSITFVAGAVAHASKLRFERPDLSRIRALAQEYISVGKWSFINHQIILARIQLFPWALAISFGTVATGTFQAALNIANLINPISLELEMPFHKPPRASIILAALRPP